MLNWLAGQRLADHGRDHDCDGDDDDAPDTPAPVFAVRAFKQAIFGTPNTAQSKQRRNSAVERDTIRTAISRPIRPGMTRPKSANDTSTLADFASLPPSPTKGILLTPGTNGGRGKTVTFGDLRKNTETTLAQDATKAIGQRPQRAGVFKERYDSLENSLVFDQNLEPTESRSQNEHICSTIDADAQPDCVVGRYWKGEYDIYREKTASEVRNLLTKQRAAKSFAREKDNQCSALTEELRNERANTAKLEYRVSELQSQVEALNAELRAMRGGSRATDLKSSDPSNTVCGLLESSRKLDSKSHLIHLAQMQNPRPLEKGAIATELRHHHETSEMNDRASVISTHEPAAVSTLSQQIPSRTRSRTGHPVPVAVYEESHQQRSNCADRFDSGAEADQRSLSDSRADLVNTYRTPSSTASALTYKGLGVQQATQPRGTSKLPFVLDNPAELKENLLLDARTSDHTNAPFVQRATDTDRRILSKDGDAIPPHRIAAARARLAARRELRACT